ncbi:ABC transporter permease [Bosea sp. AK1]|uniref:ABC transporter permease n=1 Tax=Bosea sp. AK1 TaxID=2587160 RepID=UPI00114F3347|nr:ABC transporter permease [Bosea sp. AK1]
MPVLLVTGITLLAPLGLLARYSLNEFRPAEFMVPGLTLGNYFNALGDEYYRNILANTILMSVAITLISLVVGYPMALFTARSRRFKKILLLCVILPLFIGNAVRAAGWMIAFGEVGLINTLLQRLGIIEAPVQIMYTWVAVLIGAAAVNTPFVVLTIQSVLEGISASIEEASASLGAIPAATFFKVTLPLSLPGVQAAAALSFILAMNSFATPVLLGGPSFRMMAPAIAEEIIAKNNWPSGAALAFILVTTTLALNALIHLAARGRRGT